MMYFEIDDFVALKVALHEFEQRLLAEKICEESVFTGKLVADELLSNVLQHGGGKAFFKAFVRCGEIALWVKGSNEFRPPEKSVLSPPLAESGRGLFLVDSLCSRREYSKEDGVKVYIKIQQSPLS